jgi:predicted lipoprotein with Yx(FWY)xxD motif
MKGLVLTIVAVAAALSLTFGLSIASASSSSASAGTKVAAANSNLGRILVDARGRTLYLFAKDRNGKSACSGSCAVYWPPLIASGKPKAGAGARQSLLGTTRRADGRLQVTYRHHPLYRYAGDSAKGQTNGQGLNASGGLWWVLSPAGNVISSMAAPATGY